MKSVSNVWLAKEWTTPRDVLMSNFSTAILKKKKGMAYFFQELGDQFSINSLAAMAKWTRKIEEFLHFDRDCV